MRYIAFGLLVEGPTDRMALPPLLETAIRGLAVSDGLKTPFSFDLFHAGKSSGERVAEVVNSREYDIVLVHRDGAGTPPAHQAALKAQGAVPVIPVRELEAWLLADPLALPRALGRRDDAITAGHPGPKEVEKLADPKKRLLDLAAVARGRPLRGGFGGEIEDFYGQMAAESRLLALTKVPWFGVFLGDLREGLVDLGWPFH